MPLAGYLAFGQRLECLFLYHHWGISEPRLMAPAGHSPMALGLASTGSAESSVVILLRFPSEGSVGPRPPQPPSQSEMPGEWGGGGHSLHMGSPQPRGGNISIPTSQMGKLRPREVSQVAQSHS